MMQAAQLAAEAAMQEAAARDAAAAAAAANGRSHHGTGGGGGCYPQHHHGGGSPSSEHQHYQRQHQHHQQHQQHHHPQHPIMMEGIDESMSSSSLTMNSEQLGLLRALHAEMGGGPSTLHDSISMMGMDPTEANSMQSLLQMLAQQEQENARPEEHYLTIAHNGRYSMHQSVLHS
jgi:hypothetical protein